MDSPSLMVCVPGSGGWLSNLTALDVFCYCTALIVPLLAMPATVRSWISKQLGQGGRWPPLTVAALLCNAGWFVFGWTEKSDEAFCLNLYGGAFQMVYLATFLALCTAGERTGVRNSVAIAAVFLALTATLGFNHVEVELHKLLCCVYAMVAAAMPLLNAMFIHDENGSVEGLPHWILSSISTVHGFAWFYRGVQIANPYMAAQNFLGFIFSAWLLALRFIWAQPTTEEVAGEYRQLPGGEDSSTAAAAAAAAAAPTAAAEDDDVHHDDDDVSEDSSINHNKEDPFSLNENSEGSTVDGDDSSSDHEKDPFGLNENSEGKVSDTKGIVENSAAEESDMKPDDGNNGASESSAQEASSSAAAPATPKADD